MFEEAMELKRCSNCEHFRYEYHCEMCTRYPRWVSIYDPDSHWCGEWKKIEDVQWGQEQSEVICE